MLRARQLLPQFGQFLLQNFAAFFRFFVHGVNLDLHNQEDKGANRGRPSKPFP
jgi:hypothetical protein